MLFQVFRLILLKLSSFAATWRWRERPTDPSVQQPHAEQRCVSCPLSSSDNSVSGHAHVLFSHQTSDAGIVAALLGNVLHSVSSWWQQIQTCRGYMCWEYLFTVGTQVSGCGCRQHGAAAGPCHSAWDRDYEMLMQTLHMLCGSRWSSPVLFVVGGGSKQSSTHCSSTKWPWRCATEDMFIVEIKLILFLCIFGIRPTPKQGLLGK